eukprot:COSAG05_NODE_3462_length_2045_cov_4.490236_2_plen_89_part_00
MQEHATGYERGSGTIEHNTAEAGHERRQPLSQSEWLRVIHYSLAIFPHAHRSVKSVQDRGLRVAVKVDRPVALAQVIGGIKLKLHLNA